jgi:histone deacetylase complex subunit SAP18
VLIIPLTLNTHPLTSLTGKLQFTTDKREREIYRPDEFSTDSYLPFLTLNTWADCTLEELAQHIAIANENLLPNPAIGTRLAFRLLYHDTRGGPAASNNHNKFTVRELGSVVIGDGGPGLDPDDPDAEITLEDTDPGKTLGDARFVVGDYISCAILPPLPDGSVAPASSARMGRGTGAGESRLAVGRAPYEPVIRDRNGGAFVRHGRGGGGGRGGSGRGGFDGGGYNHRGPRSGGGVPLGEWRRGEQLPDVPPGPHSRNRGNRF